MIRRPRRRAARRLLPVDSEHNAIFQCFEPRPADARRAGSSSPPRGGPFRDLAARADARRDARAGGRASELVDGRQDLGRFGDHDEQGPRADRGRPPVPGRRPSAIEVVVHPQSVDPQPGRLSSTARCWRSSARPTCACRSPTRWPGRSAWRRRASGSTWSRSARLDFEAPDLDALPRARPGPRGACRRRRDAGHAQRRQRGRGRGLP